MTRGQRMTNKRPYWQVAVSLLFSIVATVGFVLIGWKLLGFLMPFVVGWIIASIATPVVNWLEKRLKIRKIRLRIDYYRSPGVDGDAGLLCCQLAGFRSQQFDQRLSRNVCAARKRTPSNWNFYVRNF